MADKHFERVVSLATLLIKSSAPITFERIQQNLHGYRGRADAAIRKFERDKEELRSMGLNITVETDEESHQGYVIRNQGRKLPSVGLTPDELFALRLCARGSGLVEAFGGRHAATKLDGQDAALPVSDQVAHLKDRFRYSQPLEAHDAKVSGFLTQIVESIRRRKRLTIKYASARRVASRQVDPFGLFLELGRWHVVGFDHLTHERRTFLVQRIQTLKVNALQPVKPDYQIPDDFVLADSMNVQPWEYAEGPVQHVLVRFDEAVSSWVKNHMGTRVTVKKVKGGVMEVVFPVRHVEGFIKWVLPYGAKAEVLSPAPVRQAVIEAFKRIREAHV